MFSKKIDVINLSSFDRWGTCISFACAIHCIIMPFLFVSLTGFALFAHELFHVLLVVIAIVLAIASLFWGFHIHKKRIVFIPLVGGLMSIGLAQVTPEGILENFLMVLGGSLLALGHFLNQRYRQFCSRCQKEVESWVSYLSEEKYGRHENR